MHVRLLVPIQTVTLLVRAGIEESSVLRTWLCSDQAWDFRRLSRRPLTSLCLCALPLWLACRGESWLVSTKPSNGGLCLDKNLKRSLRVHQSFHVEASSLVPPALTLY